MVFAGFEELAVIGVALSLPLWLMVEELISRTRAHAERRPVKTARRQRVGGMVEHPVH
ncbi:MAG TPA: hypothetical protein VID04_02535 [Methylomirabilota bacterium]|jgi:hypothetical protein